MDGKISTPRVKTKKNNLAQESDSDKYRGSLLNLRIGLSGGFQSNYFGGSVIFT